VTENLTPNQRQQETQPQQQQQQQQRQQQQQQRRRPMMFGKSTAVTKIVAARKLTKKKAVAAVADTANVCVQPKKAVFCIDNLNNDCTSQDIVSYVNAMSIETVSCFEAKTRQRRNDNRSELADCKAFRLCIFDEDRARLLNAAMWPDSVIISDWFFKSERRDQDENQGKKRRVCDFEQYITAAAAAIADTANVCAQPCPTTNDVTTAVLSDTAVITVVEVHRDNDDTIIASHMDVDLNAENGE